jgi:ketosteroid isomerase-like protein
MKHTNYFLLGILISLVLLFFGCATISKAADWTPEQKEVIAVMDAWQKAWDSGDTDGLGKLLADDINMTSRSLGGNFRDKAKFLGAYRKWYIERKAFFKIPEQYITYLEVKVMGNEASLTRRIDWTQRGDRGTQSGTSIKSAQLKKIGNEWKIYSEK